MPDPIHDPLLAGVRGLTLLLRALALAVATVLLLGIPVALVFRERILGQIGPRALDDPGVIWAVVAILFLSAALLLLSFSFLQQMGRIIDTVREGDPFVPPNAERLHRMGWFSVAGCAASLLAAPFGAWLIGVGKWENAAQGTSGFPVSGFVLALVLFVLARVFRKGTEMRDDLEGTV